MSGMMRSNVRVVAQHLSQPDSVDIQLLLDFGVQEKRSTVVQTVVINGNRLTGREIDECFKQSGCSAFLMCAFQMFPFLETILSCIPAPDVVH